MAKSSSILDGLGIHSSVFQLSDHSATPMVPGEGRAAPAVKPQALQPGIARTHHLVGMMLALILAGDFGWNAGMAYGWPSMFLGYVLATILFWMLGLSVAEMSCSLPFSGGAATFAQAAFGQEVSAFLALSFTFAYCAGTAWAIESLASYAVVLFNFPADANNMQPLLWLALAEIFVLTNIRTRHFFKIAIAIAAFCCTAIAVYVVCSLAHLPTFQGALYQPDLPVTFLSVMQAWPWAMGFYWGLEAIPLTAEECHDITTTAPRAVKITLTVLTVFAGIALCLAVGMMPDLDTLLNSNQPMLDSFFWQLGVAPASALATYTSAAVMAIPTAGWVHSTLYAASRHTYALARAGYFPVALSYTVDGDPMAATAACAAAAYALGILFYMVLAPLGVDVDAALAQVTTWLLCVAYVVEMAVFVRLRYHMPQLPRPWVSPVGVPGAVVGALIALLGVFGPLAVDPVTTGWLMLAYVLAMLVFVAYYRLFAKQRLRMSPEKQFITAQMKRLYDSRVHEGQPVVNNGRLNLKPLGKARPLSSSAGGPPSNTP
ncbi:hypothetical protein RI367_002371 [Sorochytrium milnesiophthora]